MDFGDARWVRARVGVASARFVTKWRRVPAGLGARAAPGRVMSTLSDGAIVFLCAHWRRALIMGALTLRRRWELCAGLNEAGWLVSADT